MSKRKFFSLLLIVIPMVAVFLIAFSNQELSVLMSYGMKGIAELAIKQGIECEVSLEKRMACGIGVCLGCTFEGKSGKRWKVCGDGPVFDAEEVFG